MIKKLEALRGFAALYVLIHHIIGFTEIRNQINPWIRFPFRFGQEAVILFFLLSGFVIYYSSYKKTDTFRVYFFKRFRRIYPIFIFSILLSIVVFLINGGNIIQLNWKMLVGNLLLLQDTNNKPGINILVFLDNHALWSLSYEWIFYLLYYPILNILKYKTFRIYYVLLISILGWFSYLILPNHFSLVISYFIIWWSGVECADIYIKFKKFTFHNLRDVLICLSCMSALSIIPIVLAYNNGTFKFNQIMYPVVTLRHFWFAALIVFIGLLWWKIKLTGFNFLIGHFQKLSSISYALYIVHFPIINLNLQILTIYYGIIIFIKIILIFGLAYLLETYLQPQVNKLFK